MATGTAKLSAIALVCTGHDGRAYNVTLEPGEMALYESHTVMHGRPFPMKGRYFANCFVHFVPMDPNNPSENEPGIDFAWPATARNDAKSSISQQQTHDRLASLPKPPPAAESLARAIAAASVRLC